MRPETMSPERAAFLDRAGRTPIRSLHPKPPRTAREHWRGDCPLCGKKGNFSVSEARHAWFCHSCQTGGTPIRLVMAIQKVGPVAAAEIILGQPAPGRTARPDIVARSRPIQRDMPAGNNAGPGPDTGAIAARVWDTSRPIDGTPAAEYLGMRAIPASVLSLLAPDALRFAPAMPTNRSETRFAPAMLAAIRDAAGNVIGTHATYLSHPPSPKAVSKQMWGKARGGFARLVGGDGPLLIAEGIETVLSMLAYYHLEGRTARAWAALGLDNMAGREALDSDHCPYDPPHLATPGARVEGVTGPIIVGIDHDMKPIQTRRRGPDGAPAPHTAGATERAQRCAALVRLTWSRPDVATRIAPHGMDFNDKLQADHGRP